MMRPLAPGTVLALGAALLLCSLPVAAARNVVLIIGDGMDDQQVTIARNYLVGAQGKLTLDTLPLRATAQVLTVDEDGRPVYVADSANSATAMATGTVTSRTRIATDPTGTQHLPTIVDILQGEGFKTGLVATSSVTDATPASFVAHINLRFCENPQAIHGPQFGSITLPGCPAYTIANGGPGSIAEQIAASQVDVVLGGGAMHFDMNAEGADRPGAQQGVQQAAQQGVQTVAQQAAANGYRVVRTAAELAAAPLDDGKLLGLFAPSTMPVRWQGEGGRGAEFPKPSWLNRLHRYLGSVELPAVMGCEPNPGFANNTPTLRQMTEAALRHLRNPRGFFLMVESASIDKQAHERKPCGSIGELAQLDEALDSALAFAADNPDTLILVTADHAQAAQLIPAESLFSRFDVPVYSPGQVARIRTPEGAVMTVNYATNNFSYAEHTGAAVPLYANSEGQGRVPAMLTQPEIFAIIRDYMLGEH